MTQNPNNPELKKEDVLPRLYRNLAASVEVFGDLLETDSQIVSQSIRNLAMLRRLRIGFLALYEFLREKTQIPKEYDDKALEEIADYFIKQGCLEKDDKDLFVTLGSIYTAIRWSAPGNSPDQEKIMQQLTPLYEFLKRIVAQNVVEEVPQNEATL